MRLVILAALFLSGCASTTKARLQNLPLMKPGISKADIIDRFGEPDEKIGKPDHQIWRYSVYSDDSAHIYPYRADIKKGVLQSFDPDSGYIGSRAKKYARNGRRKPGVTVDGNNNGAMVRATTSTP